MRLADKMLGKQNLQIKRLTVEKVHENLCPFFSKH